MKSYFRFLWLNGKHWFHTLTTKYLNAFLATWPLWLPIRPLSSIEFFRMHPIYHEHLSIALAHLVYRSRVLLIVQRRWRIGRTYSGGGMVGYLSGSVHLLERG